jgi:hypothetical protein
MHSVGFLDVGLTTRCRKGTMTLPLFSPDDLPDPPSPAQAAQSIGAGKPRLRVPIRDQIVVRWESTAVKIYGRCNILEKPLFPPNYQGFSWPAQENVFLRN